MGSVTPICSGQGVAASGTSTFQHSVVNSTHNPLGVVTLRAGVTLVGARGAGLYEEWLLAGNTGDFDTFLIVASESIRPRFHLTKLQLNSFVKPESPLDSEVQVHVTALLSQPGDRFTYETPASVNLETLNKVVYHWEVVELPDGSVVPLRSPMMTPIYMRKLKTSEVRPLFHFRYDDGSGLFPTEWKVNNAGIPVQMYVNPSVDYGVVVQAIAAAGIGGGLTEEQINVLIDARIATPKPSTMTFDL